MRRLKRAMGMKAFTLAGADARQIGNKKRLFAFTLAETLITLMIIGVVAVLVIPAFMQNVNQTALAKQRQTAANKIAEGFAQMRVAGALNENYADTAAFVNAMKKYFKINQVCNSDNLTNCFVETVKSGDEENKISELNDNQIMGLVLADGVNMLIKYNPEGTKIDEGNTQIGKIGKNDDGYEYATYGDLFEYTFDVNSTKTPNKIGSDIIGNLSLAKGLNDPYGLGFEIIGGKTYGVGVDFETTYDPRMQVAFGCPEELVSSGDCGGYNNILAGQNYCTTIGGTFPSTADLQNLYDKTIDYPELSNLIKNSTIMTSDGTARVEFETGQHCSSDHGNICFTVYPESAPDVNGVAFMCIKK